MTRLEEWDTECARLRSRIYDWNVGLPAAAMVPIVCLFLGIASSSPTVFLLLTGLGFAIFFAASWRAEYCLNLWKRHLEIKPEITHD